MLQNILLYLFIMYAGTFFLGKVLQHFRIPWIFAALLVGLGLSLNHGISSELKTSDAFELLSELGLYFLLFIIGMSIDIKEVRAQGKFIVRTTAIIILGEAFVGTLLVHSLFDVSWGISALVALSFATVGEAVLLPILEEFKLLQRPLGKTILSVGVLDDIIEVATIIVLSILLGSQAESGGIIAFEHLLLAGAILISPLFIRWFQYITHKWSYGGVDNLFLGSMVIMFFFLWVGSTIGAAELAALMSGIVLKNTIPDESLENFTSEIRTMCYGFFAPLFFVSVGLSTELSAFGSLAGIILILSIGTALTKIVLTFFSTRKVLGDHGSIVAGIALTVRLSTSIVIIKILLDNNLIPAELYTALIGTTVIFKFINPILISGLIQKWNLSPVSRIK